jgi:Flp pilus assembly protein TadD
LKTQVETLSNFALAAANRGDYGQAISQLHDAIAQCGECVSRADLHKNLGLIECKSGNVQNGKKNLLVANSLKPNDPDVLKALALVDKVGTGRTP